MMSESDRLHNRDNKMADSATAICANVMSGCAPVCISKYCDENNGAGTNIWIPVKNSHSHNIRRKNTHPLNYQITLSNSFALLDNLYELPDMACTNSPKTPKKHSVLLVGDSHIRDVAERLAIKLRSSFLTIGYVKPNGDYYIDSEIRDQELK